MGTIKKWRGCLSPRLEEEYHDMLREIAKQEGKTQTDILKEMLKNRHQGIIK
ncbi:ribbon-helix-helix domain-containing protein [Clostridium niameyense]|uniref:ribbon-helix-helix domain-containing protein n=1 Tax=Clostridium niameyense TaxID=1622073 RepID=UPI0013D38349|nr:ribbon-helix-helix domain-containing protein [Clostridium niameyense]